ncbi:MAG TPA: molybdopterin-dependent oxidoreductase, partial [Terracidiphilus sp.]|nr:molybdopterin-dependent oxidoreductase [Terracidiphilus sp.]
LTSGSYRYKTRPWEMSHASTVCTHCGDGCKVSLGVRATADGAEIVRADNRDKSGINGDFLCAKGRFGFDFVESPERLTQPLVRNASGKLEPATWDHALRYAAGKLKEIRDTRGGSAIGVIGSNRTTNEENFLLQKFARTVLTTNNIDHERTADYAAFSQAMASHNGLAASLADTLTAPAILLIGGNPTEEHPLLAWNLRTNVRLNNSRLYVANAESIKLERQARATLRLEANGYTQLTSLLSDGSDFAKSVREEESLLVLFGQEIRGASVKTLIDWGIVRGHTKFACLGDFSNSRGAADMGLLPDFLPGYTPLAQPGNFAAEYPGFPSQPGLSLPQMRDALTQQTLTALLVVGADPVTRHGFDPASLRNTFTIVQDIFLTPTAAIADVVFPAASLYEKSGTVTNTFGDVQLVRKAADRPGVKSDFEILVRLAGAMGVDVKTLVPFGKNAVTADLGQSRGAQAGEADRHGVWLAANGLEPKLSPFDVLATLDEIERLVPSYRLDRLSLFAGNHTSVEPGFVPVSALSGADLITPAHDNLFTSGALGRYSSSLQDLKRHQSAEAAAAVAD